MSELRATVGVPLHRSARWVDELTATLDVLRGEARLVVSDATLDDDAIDVLRARLGDDGITWLTPADVPRGWVAHADHVRAMADTEFFAWLAHDDSIGPDWIRRGTEALDADPTAVIAVGRVVDRDGSHRGSWFDPLEEFLDADAETRVRAGLRALVSGRGSAVGLLFRGVQRRAALPPLGRVDDEWADTPWGLRVLARGRVATIDAVYTKRWAPDTASARWSSMACTTGLRDGAWADAVIDELGGETGARVIAGAWQREIEVLQASPMWRFSRRFGGVRRRLLLRSAIGTWSARTRS